MKKVQLVTLHSQNNNFGSVLQAYALYRYTSKLGYDVEVLNYRPYYSNGSINLKARIKKIIVNTMFLPHYLLRNYRFNKFIKQEKQTKKFTSYDELIKNHPEADIYMIGSDQVWNTSFLCGRDLTYYLKYTDSENKMSYGASMGRIVGSQEEVSKLVESTKEFRFISLREKKSAIQFQQSGRADTRYVLDPVFLLNYLDYTKLHVNNIQCDDDYILAYVIHKDDFISQVIEAISKKIGKKVIQVGGFASKCNYDSFPRSAGPREFLSLLEKASFVITSSFHGTAFSHIYQKQFAVVMPSSNTLRIENIIETAGTIDRVVNKISDIDKILSQDIDYNKVNLKLNKKIEDSREYLKDSLRTLSK